MSRYEREMRAEFLFFKAVESYNALLDEMKETGENLDRGLLADLIDGELYWTDAVFLRNGMQERIQAFIDGNDESEEAYKDLFVDMVKSLRTPDGKKLYEKPLEQEKAGGDQENMSGLARAFWSHQGNERDLILGKYKYWAAADEYSEIVKKKCAVISPYAPACSNRDIGHNLQNSLGYVYQRDAAGIQGSLYDYEAVMYRYQTRFLQQVANGNKHPDLPFLSQNFKYRVDDGYPVAVYENLEDAEAGVKAKEAEGKCWQLYTINDVSGVSALRSYVKRDDYFKHISGNPTRDVQTKWMSQRHDRWHKASGLSAELLQMLRENEIPYRISGEKKGPSAGRIKVLVEGVALGSRRMNSPLFTTDDKLGTVASMIYENGVTRQIHAQRPEGAKSGEDTAEIDSFNKEPMPFEVVRLMWSNLLLQKREPVVEVIRRYDSSGRVLDEEVDTFEIRGTNDLMRRIMPPGQVRFGAQLEVLDYAESTKDTDSRLHAGNPALLKNENAKSTVYTNKKTRQRLAGRYVRQDAYGNKKQFAIMESTYTESMNVASKKADCVRLINEMIVSAREGFYQEIDLPGIVSAHLEGRMFRKSTNRMVRDIQENLISVLKKNGGKFKDLTQIDRSRNLDEIKKAKLKYKTANEENEVLPDSKVEANFSNMDREYPLFRKAGQIIPENLDFETLVKEELFEYVSECVDNFIGNPIQFETEENRSVLTDEQQNEALKTRYLPNLQNVLTFGSTQLGPQQRREILVDAVRLAKLKPENFAGLDRANLCLKDGMVPSGDMEGSHPVDLYGLAFDKLAPGSAEWTKEINQETKDFLKRVKHSMLDAFRANGVLEPKISINEYGVLDWEGKVARNQSLVDGRGNKYPLQPVSGSIGQLYFYDRNGLLVTKNAASEPQRLAVGYLADIMPEKPMEHENFVDRTRCYGYEQVALAEIDAAISSAMSKISYSEFSQGYQNEKGVVYINQSVDLNRMYRKGLNIVHRFSFDYERIDTMVGMPERVRKAVIRDAKNSVRYDKTQTEAGGTNMFSDRFKQQLRNLKEGDRLQANMFSRSFGHSMKEMRRANADLTDAHLANCQVRTAPVRGMKGRFDLMATNDGTEQYQSVVITVGAKVDSNNQIVPAEDENAASAIYKLEKNHTYDSSDRTLMNIKNYKHAKNVQEAGVAYISCGGWNMEDGIVIREQFAEKCLVPLESPKIDPETGEEKWCRAIRTGDKLDNGHGDKGVTAIVVPEKTKQIPENASEKEKEDIMAVNRLVEFFQMNPKLDALFSPFSILSRNNLGEIMDGIDNHKPLRLPDGTVVSGGIAVTDLILTDKIVETGIKSYASGEESKDGKRVSGQFLIGLNEYDAPALTNYFFQQNHEMLNKFREHLLACGYDMDLEGKIDARYYDPVRATTKDGQKVFQDSRIFVPESHYLGQEVKLGGNKTRLEPNYKKVQATVAQHFRKESGFLEVRLPFSYQSGLPSEQAGFDPTKEYNTFVLPIMAEKHRNGFSQDNGEAVYSDLTASMFSMVDRIVEYNFFKNLEKNVQDAVEHKEVYIGSRDGNRDPEEKKARVLFNTMMEMKIPETDALKKDPELQKWLNNGKFPSKKMRFTDQNGNPIQYSEVCKAITAQCLKAADRYVERQESWQPQCEDGSTGCKSDFQSAYDSFARQVAEKFDGKHGLIREGLLSVDVERSAYLVASADPRVDLSTVKISSKIAKDLGITPESRISHVLVTRDPVWTKKGMCAMHVEIDDSVEGIAMNPAMAKRFDGDFDGDKFGVFAVDRYETILDKNSRKKQDTTHLHPAYREMIQKMTLAASLLDRNAYIEDNAVLDLFEKQLRQELAKLSEPGDEKTETAGNDARNKVLTAKDIESIVANTKNKVFEMCINTGGDVQLGFDQNSSLKERWIEQTVKANVVDAIKHLPVTTSQDLDWVYGELYGKKTLTQFHEETVREASEIIDESLKAGAFKACINMESKETAMQSIYDSSVKTGVKGDAEKLREAARNLGSEVDVNEETGKVTMLNDNLPSNLTFEKHQYQLLATSVKNNVGPAGTMSQNTAFIATVQGVAPYLRSLINNLGYQNNQAVLQVKKNPDAAGCLVMAMGAAWDGIILPTDIRRTPRLYTLSEGEDGESYYSYMAPEAKGVVEIDGLPTEKDFYTREQREEALRSIYLSRKGFNAHLTELELDLLSRYASVKQGDTELWMPSKLEETLPPLQRLAYVHYKHVIQEVKKQITMEGPIPVYKGSESKMPTLANAFIYGNKSIDITPSKPVPAMEMEQEAGPKKEQETGSDYSAVLPEKDEKKENKPAVNVNSLMNDLDALCKEVYAGMPEPVGKKPAQPAFGMA